MARFRMEMRLVPPARFTRNGRRPGGEPHAIWEKEGNSGIGWMKLVDRGTFLFRSNAGLVFASTTISAAKNHLNHRPSRPGKRLPAPRLWDFSNPQIGGHEAIPPNLLHVVP